MAAAVLMITIDSAFNKSIKFKQILKWLDIRLNVTTLLMTIANRLELVSAFL